MTPAEEAEALLAEAHNARLACAVARSGKGELVAALAERGAQPPFIREVLFTKFQIQVADTTLRFHINKRCMCHRPSYHATKGVTHVGA